MILEGDTSVIDAIKEKKRLMDAGEEHEHIKPLLIIDGGLMKGVYGAGAVVALEEFGFSKVFSNVVGISSGAPTAAYFLAGNAAEGATIFYEECCDGNFLNLLKLSANTTYVMDVFKGSTGKALSVENVLTSNSNLYLAAASYETTEPVFLVPENAKTMFDAIHASILMPTMSSLKLYIDAVRYVDGGFAKPSAIAAAVDFIEATHVLLITNQNKTHNEVSFWEHILIETLFRFRMNSALRKIAHFRKEERVSAISYIQNQYENPVAIVWGDGSIEGVDHEAKKVRSVFEKSRQWWQELLAK